MNPTKKFWYDENSEPPKNYIWVKGGQQYGFNSVNRKWSPINQSVTSNSFSIITDAISNYILYDYGVEERFEYVKPDTYICNDGFEKEEILSFENLPRTLFQNPSIIIPAYKNKPVVGDHNKKYFIIDNSTAEIEFESVYNEADITQVLIDGEIYYVMAWERVW